VRPVGRLAGWSCLLALLPLSAQHHVQIPTTKGEEHGEPAKAPARGMTDAQAAELARNALRLDNPASIKSALARLKGHTFKSSKVPERELVLYAQGTLEAQLGNTASSSVALKNLERQWPRSPFMGEAHTLLAEAAVVQKRYKEAETRLHKALASDIPAERKRKPQELLIWTLVEQGRAEEALPIVQSLSPLEANQKPSERGLAAMAEVLAGAGEQQQALGCRNDFHAMYPASKLMARVDLAWGRMLGRAGDAKEAAQVLRKVITDFPDTTQADDARLALASLLTDGSLKDTKGLPSAESLLAEVRRGGRKGLPMGTAQVVELRLMVGKSLFEDALNLVERMEPGLREGEPEVRKLWTEAWKAWVGQRVEKGFAGELLVRMQAGAFRALDEGGRKGVAELLAREGLLDVLIRLLPEAPLAERPSLRRTALAKVQPEAQPQALLRLLPAKGDSPEEALLRARAEAALEHWPPLRAALGRAKPGAERIKALLRLLQRPLASGETAVRRLAEAEGWLARAPEKGEAREPLAILVADFRMQKGDLQGALALYPAKAAAPEQRGWVALMRAQAFMKLGQWDQARALIKGSRDEQGFKGQRDAIAKSLGAY